MRIRTPCRTLLASATNGNRYAINDANTAARWAGDEQVTLGFLPDDLLDPFEAARFDPPLRRP